MRRFLEFFAGVGMARLGLADGWNCAWANDLDPNKARIYRHNYGDGHLDDRDVHRVAEELAGGGASSLPTDCLMAWASFPCQDLSLAGDRGGLDARRSGSYWPFWQIMRDLRAGPGEGTPRIVVLENVVGLLSDTASFRGLCSSLAQLDMRFGAVKLDARDFLPQSRPRVFVVAVDAQARLDGFVGPDASALPGRQTAVQKAHDALPTELQKRWTWWRLPLPDVAKRPSFRDYFEEHPADVPYNTAAQTDYLLSLMNDRHRAKVVDAQASGARQFGFLYRRTRAGQQRAEVRFDGVAGCLRTSRGGSSRQTLVIVEGEQVHTRLLSRLEQARLMGIALDDHGRLPGSDRPFLPPELSFNEACDAMGDGVAVPVVRYLDRCLLTPLAARAVPTTTTWPRLPTTRVECRA